VKQPSEQNKKEIKKWRRVIGTKRSANRILSDRPTSSSSLAQSGQFVSQPGLQAASPKALESISFPTPRSKGPTGFLRNLDDMLPIGERDEEEWSAVLITHYPDDRLEEIRRNLVRVTIADPDQDVYPAEEVVQL